MDVFPSEKQNYIQTVVQGSSGLSGGSLTDSLPGHREVHRVVGDGSTHRADWLQDMQARDAMCASEHVGHLADRPSGATVRWLEAASPTEGEEGCLLETGLEG